MAKYSKAAQEKVHEEMHEMKKGKLKSGSGKKVTNPKQAIAIALLRQGKRVRKCLRRKQRQKRVPLQRKQLPRKKV